jgi:hypothetical protein
LASGWWRISIYEYAAWSSAEPAIGGLSRIADRCRLIPCSSQEIPRYHDYEALDSSIVQTIIPQHMPQR